MKPLTWRRLVDRKIVEYLVAGKSRRRWIKRNLKIGSGRFEKVSALAQQHGYLRSLRYSANTPAPYAYRGLPASCFVLPWRAATVRTRPSPLMRAPCGIGDS